MEIQKRHHIALWIVLLSAVSACGIRKSQGHLPDIAKYNQTVPVVVQHSDTLRSTRQNYLIKNKHHIWELYTSGDPLQLGMVNGSLTENLIHKQEQAFFTMVEDFIPSSSKQRFLKFFLKVYNRKMYLNISNEYLSEIYGVSRYSSEKYNHVANKYQRSLSLHGAHDIGHAMQDLMLVGCSSMAVWGEKSEDGSMLLGRNFDFYAGDEFAEEKVISFVKPETGIPYMSISWPGMIGVVSGMNLEGLTVTINAGKSKIPWKAKTPISILTREILQHASTIEEAIEIAKNKEVFVSESIMVGSAKDKNVVLIEISPKNFGVFQVENTNQLVCSNHFQSEAYQKDKRNQEHIKTSHSKYRYERMEELITEKDKLNTQKMVDILRDTKGLNEKEIGYGNEKALNQLLGHHSIVFKPEQKIVWVSTNPYQLGEFIAYDLNEIFNGKDSSFISHEVDSLLIEKDPFVNSFAFKKYEEYRILDREIDRALDLETPIESDILEKYKNANPEFWVVYFKTGMYYYQQKDFNLAKIEFEKALSKEITTVQSKESVLKYLKKSTRKSKR